VEVGADMIETDLRLSADGVVHLAHDRVEERRPSGLAAFVPRRRSPLAWRRIQEIGALAGGGSPALDELLDRFAARIELNLELKERAAVAPLVACLRRRRLEDGLLLSSFDGRTLRQLREALPRARLAVLLRRPPPYLARVVRALGAEAIHARLRDAGPALARRAHALGVKLHVFTVNDPAAMRRLSGLGVDGIFTDDPAAARALVGPPAPERRPA
jgi:glycerophosphoryl diester phosphodiesterase